MRQRRLGTSVDSKAIFPMKSTMGKDPRNKGPVRGGGDASGQKQT